MKLTLPSHKSRLTLRFAPPTRASAFSLVEVVLAMGIISFGLLAVIGLMPVGLNTMRDAMDDTAEALIANRVTGEVMLTPFSEMDTVFNGRIYFFDEEGQAQSGETNFTRYRVTTRIVTPDFPGANNAPVILTDHLKVVSVEVATQNAPGSIINRFDIPVPSSGN